MGNIFEILQASGINPAGKTKKSFLYHSPFREDKHPSFSVSFDGVFFYDFATGEKGNYVTFRKKAKECGLRCYNYFDAQTTTEKQKTQYKPNLGANTESKENFETKYIESHFLLKYCRERGIHESMVRDYCREAEYHTKNGKVIKAISFRNNSKGYELRNPFFKGTYGKKDITLIHTPRKKDCAVCAVFEGFFDMLSYVSITASDDIDFLVLNSVTNTHKAIPQLQRYSKVLLYLDNDQAGSEATKQIQESLNGKVIDQRKHYQGSKDLNEKLCKEIKHKV